MLLVPSAAALSGLVVCPGCRWQDWENIKGGKFGCGLAPLQGVLTNAFLNMKYFQATGLLLASVVGANARTFTVFNACPFTIWYVQAIPLVEIH